MIVSADGLILTNNHVAEAGDDIMVRLSSGHQYKAKKVGNDPGIGHRHSSDRREKPADRDFRG